MAEDTSTLQPVDPDPIRKSFLDLVNECDSFPYPDSDPDLYDAHVSTYFTLLIPPCPRPLGYVLPSVALTLQGISGWAVDESQRTLTLVLPKPSSASTLFAITSDETATNDDTRTEEQQRSAIFARTAAAMQATGHFAVLSKWRDELYPIFWHPPPATTNPASPRSGSKKTSYGTTGTADAQDPRPRAEILASVERSASPLFGIVTYGCHLTAYTRQEAAVPASSSAGEATTASLQIWVPRRAYTKGTYPGMLDQTVAGGIATGETAFESLVREAAEEASLPAELVRRKARAVGTVSYFHVRDERAGGESGLLQPECQFCYDLDLTGETGADGGAVRPVPGDDEVHAFELMGVPAVLEALSRGEFKPNCALVILDFLIRHGVITAEEEGDYTEIVTRLHRRLEFPSL